MIRDATFNVAHWEFAYKYFKISYEVPLVLRGEQPNSRSVFFFNCIYYSLWVFNVLVAVLSGFNFIVYNNAEFRGQNISQETIIFSEAFHFSVGFAQLISGFVLVYSLIVIAIELRKSDTGD